jgi:hypothetical protein
MSASFTSKHGTQSRYTNGRCRCDECRAGHAAYQSQWVSGECATAAELREWAHGLGFDIPRRIPKPLIDRWNRERPDRPYRGANPAT